MTEEREHFTIDEDDHLEHYGIRRRSGRYPWGSGKNPEQRSRDFLGMVANLRKQGLSDTEIAKAFSTEEHPFTTTMLRATTTIARAQKRAADISMAERLKEKGLSNGAIAQKMGLSGESQVRALLAPGAKNRGDVLESTANMLKSEVDSKGFVDVGIGVERYVGLSRTTLDTAISMVKSDGYEVIKIQEDQLGTGNKTTIQVLTPPGTTYRDVVTNKGSIQQLTAVTKDGGKTFTPQLPPISVSSKRVGIAFKEDGGDKADGVIYVRPGKEDLSLGGSRYAQVRIAVDGTHYMKGMAVYKDDLPDGVDLLFNTNKTKGTPILGDKDNSVLKPMKDDPEDPFGAGRLQQITKKDKNGNDVVTSVMNRVNEEGKWDDWSRNLPSQMLSKQKPILAKEQLDKTYNQKKKDLDEIMALTNPAVRRKLLESYASDVDSSAVHLKAAPIDRQATRVILPVNSLKDNEVYAPGLRHGENVVLVRFPHGGTFEIPELKVNNNHPDAKTLLGDARDAIGINHKVAERLSGADFDGDTVLVIPNNGGKVKSTPALEKLKDFDPKSAFPAYEGMPKMSPKQKQAEMGYVSNLITDMTIKGANTNEIARAVRHSMVVIDAEKHNLNYKLSYDVHGIAALKEKYQGGANRGASTLISRTTSDVYVPKRKQSFRIDPDTGEKIYNYTGEKILKRKQLKVKDPVTGKKVGAVDERGRKIYDPNDPGKLEDKTTKSTKGAEVKDAHLLTSAYDSQGRRVGSATPIEKIYADHANRLKALANAARKEQVNTKAIPYSPSAARVYAKEVATLNAKLNQALKNAPLERQAQLIANEIVRQKRLDNPHLDADDLKKLSGKELIAARARVGAGKDLVDITDAEWEAIQAGAISNNKLSKILNNSNIERVKELATPREARTVSTTKLRRAEQLRDSGKTLAEIADIIGVPLGTLKNNLSAG